MTVKTYQVVEFTIKDALHALSKRYPTVKALKDVDFLEYGCQKVPEDQLEETVRVESNFDFPKLKK